MRKQTVVCVTLTIIILLATTGFSMNASSLGSYDWTQRWPDGRGNTYMKVNLPAGQPQLAWSEDINNPTAPIVFDNMLFFGVGSQATCVDLNTSETKWVSPLMGEILCSPAMTAGRIVFCDKLGAVYSMDMDTGEIKDRAQTQGRIEVSPVVMTGAGGDILIASTSSELIRFSPDLRQTWKTELNAPLYTAPIITGQGIIQLASDGRLVTLDPKNGEILESKLTIAQNGALQPCQNSGFLNVTIANKAIRFMDDKQFEAVLPTNASVQTSIPSGNLLVGTQRALMMLDGIDTVWSVETKSSVSSISVNDTIAFYGTADGKYGAVDINTGETLWDDYTAGEIRHPMILMKSGMVITTTNRLSYRQLWDIKPDPQEIDFGHVPTGETKEMTFNLTNPADSAGALRVEARCDSELIEVRPPMVEIDPGQTTTFTIILESQGIKEGRFYTSVVLETPTSIMNVSVSYYIVPQPFVASISIGKTVMNMKRGTARWDVTLDHPPYIKNDRTMVPLRAISESFGPKVEYVKGGCDDGKNQVIITLGDTIIHHCIGTATLIMSVEGSPWETLTFDTPSEIKNDRTFVPIRFIAEAFDAQVGWNGETKMVTITYQP